MARRVDGRKVEVWGQRLRRYGGSGLTVAEFCRREGVSVPSFYQWRSRLGIGGAGRGAGRRRRGKARSQAGRAGTAAGVVQVASAGKPAAFQAIEVPSVALAVGMTVELPGQVQLRVAGDVQLIEAVMRELIAATGIHRGGTAC
jgi:hypothetical protein